MESEEAILENDNNFNVELEYTLRDKDPQQAGQEFLDNIGCDTSNTQDASPALDMQDESDVVMSDDTWKSPTRDIEDVSDVIPGNTLRGATRDIQGGSGGVMSGDTLKTPALDTFGLPRCSTEELMAEAESFKNERAAGTSTRLAESSEEIQDYEDFIGNEDMSQQEESAQFKVSTNIDSVGKESQIASPSEFQEPMEVDSGGLDYADTPAAGIPRQAGGVELVDENIAASVPHLQPDDEERDREQRENDTIGSETSKEADPFETDQSGSSRDERPVSADGYADSLEENLESSASGHAVTRKDEMLVDRPAVPVFSQQENDFTEVFKEVNSSVENEQVANEEDFSIEDKDEDRMGVDSSHQDKGDAENVNSPYPDEGDAKNVGSPYPDKGDDEDAASSHEDKGDDAEDLVFPHLDNAEDLGSPHQEKTEVMGSPHHDKGDDAEDMGFPYQDKTEVMDSPHHDKGDDAEDMGFPHQVTGDVADNISSPYQDKGDDAKGMGSPPNKGDNADNMCSPHQDTGDDVENVGSPHQKKEDDAEDLFSLHQDKGDDAEDIDSPHADKGDNTEVVGSPHQDKGADAEDICSPYQDKGDDAEDLSSPHQDKGDDAEDLSSPQDKGDDAEDLSSPHQDKGDDDVVGSPHQDKGDDAEDLSSPHRDKGDDAGDKGSHDKDKNVEFINSFIEDRDENYARIDIPSQDRGTNLTRVDALFQDGCFSLTDINSSVEDKKEEHLCVDSSHQDKEDGVEKGDSSKQDMEDATEDVDFSHQDKKNDAEEVDFSHQDKEDVSVKVNFSHQDKEDYEEVDFSHQDKEDYEEVDFSHQDKEDYEVDFSQHGKGALIRGVDREEAVTDVNPANKDRGSDVEEMDGAVLHHRSNLSAEKCISDSAASDNVFNDIDASSDKKLVDADSPKNEFGVALEGEDVTREAKSEAGGSCRGGGSDSPGSRDVEADDADKSVDVTLPRSASAECQNQEGTHVDGVTEAETHAQDESSDSERTSDSTTVDDRTSNSTTVDDRTSNSTTVDDRTSNSTTVNDRTSNSTTVGDRISNSEAAGDRTSNSEAAGDRISNSDAAGNRISNSTAVGDRTSNSETAGNRISNSTTASETLVSFTSTESRQMVSSESDSDTVIDASVNGDTEEAMEVTAEALDTEPRRLQSGGKTVLSEIPHQDQDLCDAKPDTDLLYGEQSTRESLNTSRNSNKTPELMDVDESTLDSSDAVLKVGGVETSSLPAAVDPSEGNNTKGKGTVTRNTADSVASSLTQDTNSAILQDTSPTHLVPDTNPTPLVPDVSAKPKQDVDLIPKTEAYSTKTESDSSKTEANSGKPAAGFGKSVKKEAAQKSAAQSKAEQAPAVTTKRPQRARRTGSRVENKAAAAPIKKETLETKFNENGLKVKHSVAGSEEQLMDDEDKGMVTLASSDSKKTESRRSKSSRTQTCLVCQKICKCKYNIVRNGDVKHLCDDPCFKQFRKTPSAFLKGPDNSKSSKKSSKAAEPPRPVPAEAPVVIDPHEMEPRPNATYKTCSVCQLLNLNASQPFCNWKGLDFCGESCLGKFQANLNSVCSFCHAVISVDLRPGCCVKIGADMHLFCKPRCCNEFKKKLRLCSFCQRDVSGILGAFTAMVGKAGKLKEFCSQVCMRKLESRMKEFDLLLVEKGGSVTCSNCRKNKPLKYNVWLKGKLHTVCSDACFSAFKYTNNISTDACDSCGTVCSSEEAQTHFVQYAGQLKQFCSDVCVSHFCKANSRIESCGWCGTKKMNFDMIERQNAENKFVMFCSLDCLALCHVQLQTKTGQPVACDQCKKVEPAQYHLTMSDASIRNYCSYSCVLMATNRTSPGAGSTSLATPATNRQPQTPVTQQQKIAPSGSSRGRGRAQINTRQAAARQQSESVPVISNVVSLASPGEQHQRQPSLKSTPNPAQAVPPQPSTQKAAPSHPLPSQSAPSPAASHVPAPHLTTPSGATRAAAGNVVPSGDGKHQILIQSPPPKVGKNRSVQCKPLTQTKATSCKPHSQARETQTDELLPKTVYVPIPVPVYVPMPTVMFTAPAPKLIPFPIPIPVPIFIPTTRKSVNGIFKTIQDILERMPADPLEAELLMMAEAVAADGRPGDSDTDSEADTIAEDFSVPAVEEDVIRPAPREDDALLLRKGERQGEEDMIQMALRMAEEMSGPIEDLETSVQPVAVSSEAPQQHLAMQSYESQTDDDYIPPRSAQRVTKRASRGRTPVSRVKRARMERPYHDDASMQSQIQSMEPPPDANFRLKFTYGVNAWRHWVASKNTEIEKAKQTSGNYKLRNFPSDLLKCTTEDLNNTLCMFIREVRKPNGDEYSPDSIYYLCLGIQQYLFENGRIENIFTDMYFERFTDCLNENLKTLRPKINSQGQMLCRIEEEHLWESKQLGAHSPFILLNTLIYFHTKHFILKTAQEHMALSFAQILKHWKKGMPLKGQNAASGKNVSLRFYCLANGKKDGLAARKNKDGLPVYEVTENFDNPLRCPVKLYEFFLSKCPESIKNRNDIFYPVPERSCVPDSPVWYSTQSIDVHTMDKMLTRVLLVREIQEAHLHAQPIYM